MKRRLISLFLAVTLVLGCMPAAGAAAPSVTRLELITLLANYAGVNAEDWNDFYLNYMFDDLTFQDEGVEYVNWALRTGVLPQDGSRELEGDTAVTRQELAVLLQGFLKSTGRSLPARREAPEFSDADTIDPESLDAINLLCQGDVLRGTQEGAFLYFYPGHTVTKAECVMTISRLLSLSIPVEQVEAETLVMDVAQVDANLGQKIPLRAAASPYEITNDTIYWFSSDDSVAVVNGEGMVTCVGYGYCVIYAYTAGGLSQGCTIYCDDLAYTDEIAYSDETYEEKCERVFGAVVPEHRKVYATEEIALANMVDISIQVWDFDASGQKVTKTMYLQVNRNIAPTVKAIFEMIYNGSEKFPIKSVGGYRYCELSEHTVGLAIDINPLENYYCDPQGRALVGYYWKPYEDPYSITPDGDVVAAFEYYGWHWGVDWSTGYKDYMHFSYFGT